MENTQNVIQNKLEFTRNLIERELLKSVEIDKRLREI